MAVIRAFLPVKLICGLIAGSDAVFDRAEERLVEFAGPCDGRSGRRPFDLTTYYEAHMGPGLRRSFLSFGPLLDPSRLSGIKRRTNDLESALQAEFGGERRIVNIDPGYLTPAALVIATAKDFSHRIPLADGIYAHLEFLFRKNGIRCLSWTYPDFRDGRYTDFFLEARAVYLRQLRTAPSPGRDFESGGERGKTMPGVTRRPGA